MMLTWREAVAVVILGLVAVVFAVSIVLAIERSPYWFLLLVANVPLAAAFMYCMVLDEEKKGVGHG